MMDARRDKATREQTYSCGDLCEYTGQSMILYGGLFYEVRMLEGIHTGALKVITQSPKGA